MDKSQLELKNQICFPIYSASKLITKAYKPHLDQFGLTYPQYLVLLVLWGKDKLTVNSIKEKLMLETNTLSPMLKRMEKSNLIKRIKSVEDERSVIIELTTKGKQLQKEAIPIPEKLLSTILSEQISLDEIIQLKDTLNILVRQLKEKI